MDHDYEKDTEHCYHFNEVSDQRCPRYWREEFILYDNTRVAGKIMAGSYRSGLWRFCPMHARIFKRDMVRE